MRVCVCMLGLSDSENNAITIVKTVVFRIVITITIIIGFVWIYSIHQFINNMIRNKGAKIC